MKESRYALRRHLAPTIRHHDGTFYVVSSGNRARVHWFEYQPR